MKKLELQSTFLFLALVLIPRLTWAAMTFSEFQRVINRVTRNGTQVILPRDKKKAILEMIHQQIHVMGRSVTTGLVEVPSYKQLSKDLPVLFSQSPDMKEVLNALNARRVLLNKTNIIPIGAPKANRKAQVKADYDGTFQFTCLGSKRSFDDLVNQGTLSSIQGSIQQITDFDFTGSSVSRESPVRAPQNHSSEDHQVASQLVEVIEKKFRDGGVFVVKNTESVIDGISRYLQDRRTRNKGLTQEHLLSLVFNNDIDFDTSDLQIDTNWLNSFKESNERPSSHSHKGLNAVKELENLAFYRPVNRPFIKGKSAKVSTFQNDNGEVHFLKIQGHEELMQIQNALGEVAAYRLSQLLGLDIVEKTRLVESAKSKTKGKAEIGSLREKVLSPFKQAAFLKKQRDGFYSENILKDPRWQIAISNLRTLEYILGASDRNMENLFFDPDSHKIKGIDYDAIGRGIPLAKENWYPYSGGLFPVQYSNESLNQKIQTLTYEELRSALHDVAVEEEIENIWMRIQIVKADVEKLHS